MIDSVDNLHTSLKSKLCFTFLPAYADFLIEHKLDRYITDGIRLSKEMDLPIMRYFMSFSDEELRSQSRQSTLLFLHAMSENKLHQQFLDNMHRWRTGQLQVIEKDQLVAEDITIGTHIRKKLLMQFIPDYTSDMSKAFAIIEELDTLLYQGELVAFKTYIDIQNEKIAKQFESIEQINDQLNDSTDLFKQAQSLTHIGNWSWDVTGDDVLWSDEMYRIYGLEPQSQTITYEGFLECIYPDDRHAVEQHMRTAFENHLFPDFYHRIVLPDGTQKILHAKGQVITNSRGEIIRMVGTGQDVTRQKMMETAILENQKFIQKIASVSPLLLAVYNINTGKYLFINESIQQILGYAQNKVLQEGLEFFLSILHPDDVDHVMQKNNEALMRANAKGRAGEEEIVEFRYRLLHNDGNYRWVHTYGTVFDRNADGQVEHVINATVDITEEDDLRRQVENEKAFAELLVESSPYMVLSYDKNFYVTTWNKKTEEHTGITKEDAMGKNILELFPEYNNETWLYQIDKVFAGEPMHFPKVKFHNVDGYGESFAIPLKNGSQEVIGLLSITNNISDLLTATETIKKANRELRKINRELDESRNFFQTLIDSSPDDIVVLDKQMRYLLMNKQAAGLINTTPQEVIGKKITDVIPDILDHALYDQIQRCLNGEIVRDEVIQSVITNRYLQTVFIPLLDDSGEVYGALLTGRDISKIIQSTRELEAAKSELERMNTELIRSEDLYHKMVSEVENYAIFLLDKYGIIESWNKGAEHIKGYKAHEIIGKHFSVFYTLDDRNASLPQQLLEKAATTGKAEHEGWRVNKDGSLFWCLVVITALYNEDHEVIGFSKVTRDLSERKKAEDQLKNYAKQLEDKNYDLEQAREELADDRTKLLVSAMPQIIGLANKNGVIEFANDMMSNYTGATFENLKGIGWLNYVHEDDRPQLSASIDTAMHERKTVNFEFRLRRGDGNYLWHKITAKPLTNTPDAPTMWVAIINNIHEQKLLDAKKDEFMGIASHELKTPLTSIKAYVQLLRDSIENGKMEDAAFLVKKADQSIGKLNELIVDLLDITTIQHGKLKLNVTGFDLDELVNNTIELIQPTVRHNIRKTADKRCMIEGDSERLQQVFFNLITNAVKYSPSATVVDIDIQCKKDLVLVSVTDYGIGIPKSDIEKIFSRFYRVEGNAHQFQGLGIGLFISAEIVQRHNGTIWVESEPGKGSVFYFTLPKSSP